MKKVLKGAWRVTFAGTALAGAVLLVVGLSCGIAALGLVTSAAVIDAAVSRT